MAFYDTIRFKDINWSNGTVRAKVMFSRFSGRFKEAQIWLDNRINLDMMPYIPFRTGKLQGAINRENDMRRGTGEIVAYTLPYGKPLYDGINKRTGLPFHYTNPLTTPRWFDTVAARYKDEWYQGVKDIIHRR